MKYLLPEMKDDNYNRAKNISHKMNNENDKRAKYISPLRCALNIMTKKFYLNIVNQMF